MSGVEMSAFDADFRGTLIDTECLFICDSLLHSKADMGVNLAHSFWGWVLFP